MNTIKDIRTFHKQLFTIKYNDAIVDIFGKYHVFESAQYYLYHLASPCYYISPIDVDTIEDEELLNTDFTPRILPKALKNKK